jgi:hypothetical protein
LPILTSSSRSTIATGVVSDGPQHVGAEQRPGDRRDLVELCGVRHRDAEAEGDAEPRLRHPEEALRERVGDGDRRRGEGKIDGEAVELQHDREGGQREGARPRASQGRISPAASGRLRVRSTAASKPLSARSLMAQPAERVSTVPRTKRHSTTGCGTPWRASHNPHSVGQRSSRMPIGLSSRTSFS